MRDAFYFVLGILIYIAANLLIGGVEAVPYIWREEGSWYRCAYYIYRDGNMQGEYVLPTTECVSIS